jgi:hypothetical protein
MAAMSDKTSRRNAFPFSRLLAVTLSFWAFATISAAAQQSLRPESSFTPQERADNDFMIYFYKDARPERLVGFLDKFGNTNTDWNAFPPLAGFFAVVFRAHPDWIDRLVPANVSANTAQTIMAALQLAGQPEIPQSLRTRLSSAGSDPRLSFELANLPPRLEDLPITLPTHLDILWGAFFASGDDRYVRMILDFFAKTANRSEGVALDITKTTIAIAGGPQDVLGRLKGKYGEAGTRQIVFASAAEWGLCSNAQQHPTVDKVLTSYFAENPDSLATKSLTIFRKMNK